MSRHRPYLAPEGPSSNDATLAAAAAFDAVRALEARGSIRPIDGRLSCSVKVDGSVVVWAGRDLEDARRAGNENHAALELELDGRERWPSIRRGFLVLGTCKHVVSLRAPAAPPALEVYRDGESRPAFPPFREVL